MIFSKDVEQNIEQWYAMRVTYQRELIAKRFLDERNIESFVPVRQERRLVGGRSCLRPRALLHNYIFIHSTREKIDELKRVMFLPQEGVELAKGERVRIIAGPFVGAEGVLTKITGVRDRRVVVKIEGVAAVAAPTLPAEFVERI